ncbi:MAG: Npt1/Npt2 family nucleotide transporter [Steroidobacteraceae bacterium]
MHSVLKRLVDVRPEETRALLWSFAYFFCVLSGYYVLRPLRDEMGIAGGTRNLPWLFTATFATLLIAAPLLAAVVARLPRRRFIPVVYLFFVANLAVFWMLLQSGWQTQIVARAFFVWITMYSVFTVSVFWSFMADLYSSAQSKRLFGFIAAGGSVGTLLGPLITRQLAEPLGPVNLLLIAAGFLILAIICAAGLEVAAADVRAASPGFVAASAERERQAVGGGVMDGFALLFRSRYLGGIALWVFLLSLCQTFLYLQQAELVALASDDPAARTKIFATIDLAAGILTLVMQLLATGKLITRFGTGPAAAFLPFVFIVGFLVLAVQPMLLAVVVFQAAQRAAQFGIANPARESLFTVVTREEKFKAKNLVDGAVFRGGDALNAWLFKLLAAFVALPALAVATAVVAGGWLLLALSLGRSQERKARAAVSASPVASTGGRP